MQREWNGIYSIDGNKMKQKENNWNGRIENGV